MSQVPPNTCWQVYVADTLPSSPIKNLGVYFDFHMTSNIHVNKRSKKILDIVLYINRSKECCNRRARITLMQTLVLSVIKYGWKTWGAADISPTQQLKHLQNFAAKVASGQGANEFDHATSFLRGLCWLKVHQKYKDTAPHGFDLSFRPLSLNCVGAESSGPLYFYLFIYLF